MGAPPTNALDTAPLSIGADVYGSKRGNSHTLVKVSKKK